MAAIIISHSLWVLTLWFAQVRPGLLVLASARYCCCSQNEGQGKAGQGRAGRAGRAGHGRAWSLEGCSAVNGSTETVLYARGVGDEGGGGFEN
jgi:hypothetical protein